MRELAMPCESQDGALVARLRAGEETAFETLVRAHHRRLLAVARRVLRDHEEARDAVQDAFLLAFRALGTFQDGQPLSPWLRRILINVSISRLRSRRPTARLTEAPRRAAGGSASGGDPERGRGAVDALLLRRELRARVQECIERLPDAYRQVVRLRYFREHDLEETARLLGESTSAVKSRLHRARLRMRAMLR
jgi:RNA polymerase sigma-70 factor (ECF subfamily)